MSNTTIASTKVPLVESNNASTPLRHGLSDEASSAIVPIMHACIKSTTTNTNDGYNDTRCDDSGHPYDDEESCVNVDVNPTMDDINPPVDDDNGNPLEDVDGNPPDADGLYDNGYNNNECVNNNGNPLDDVNGNPLDADADALANTGYNNKRYDDDVSDNDDQHPLDNNNGSQLDDDDGNPLEDNDGNPVDEDDDTTTDDDEQTDDDDKSVEDGIHDNTDYPSDEDGPSANAPSDGCNDG
jgi:hypothetical protein